jgi:transposase
MIKRTTQQHCIETSSVLYLSFELSSKKWKLGFSIGLGQKTRIRTMDSGDLTALKAEINLARKRFKLPETFRVVSCYEAGRDGFWLHRCLTKQGIGNFIVDSASIEVNRRKRRAKADKLDVDTLVRMLIRYDSGDRRVWSVVRVPSVEEEDGRQLHRELATLKKEMTRTSNRIRGLLATQGIRIKGKLDLRDSQLERIRMWDKQPLAAGLKDRIRREWQHMVFLMEQISVLNRERHRALHQENRVEAAPDIEKIRQLQKLRSLGPVGAWVLVKEIFGWRHFKNGRQVGSLAGLAPAPYQSGDTNADQGISKAGIVPVRRIAIELAWGWLRYQPRSKLTLWYNERFAKGGKKARKVGIVAVARRLLIELWRYLETGVIPEGAELKTAL